MTAKEKSEQLINKYLDVVGRHYHDCIYYAKKCSLICINEMLELAQGGLGTEKDWDYWQEVKKEIEKL